MNLFVHGIEAQLTHGDALSNDNRALDLANIIMTNPPFGTRGSSGSPRRDDLPYATSNKQLMFVQHIYRGLVDGGRAAIVLPDNVLFEGNVAQRIRVSMMQECDLHTILRLPNGIFYAGVKTNVLFFTRRQGDLANSRNIWVYDARTNVPTFGKRTPLTGEFFNNFERSFGEDPAGQDRDYRSDARDDRWKRFDRHELQQGGDNLDVRWLREESRPDDGVAEAEEIAAEILSSLNVALSEVKSLADMFASSQRTRDE